MTLREILRIAGFGGCWAAFVVFLIIWTQAFMAPSRTTIVGVNWSGEGLLELLLLFPAFVLCSWAFLSDLRWVWRSLS